jgi:Protein of unknown function (DUF1647)
MNKPIKNQKILYKLLQAFRKIEVIPYLLPLFNDLNDSFVIVTGADSSHFKSLCQLLLSVFRFEINPRVVVYDLGLSETERQYLQKTFSLEKFRRFDYSQYPDYFNMKINSGEYAWKPVIIDEVLNEFKGCVCWMDAGNIVTGPLNTLRKIVNNVGMYSPVSQGLIVEWTHPETLKYLNVSKNLMRRRNLTGACVSAKYENLKARNLVCQWKHCALTRECIAPEGSSRKNHRQDQAVLSVLAHQSGITKGMPTSNYGFKIHQDID